MFLNHPLKQFLRVKLQSLQTLTQINKLLNLSFKLLHQNQLLILILNLNLLQPQKPLRKLFPLLNLLIINLKQFLENLLFLLGNLLSLIRPKKPFNISIDFLIKFLSFFKEINYGVGKTMRVNKFGFLFLNRLDRIRMVSEVNLILFLLNKTKNT